MGVMLWSHQQEALQKMTEGCILKGGVGSGKSLTALAYIVESYETPRSTSPSGAPAMVYIICTAKKRNDREWHDEVARMGLEERGYSVVIDSWNNIAKYKGVRKAFFIFDEARGGGQGSWGRAFIKIARQNRWILLSATPGDDWMDYLNVFLAHGFYRNKTDFVEQHVEWDRFAKYPKVKRWHNQSKLQGFKRLVTVEMPDKRHTRRIVEWVDVPYDKMAFKTLIKDRFDPWKMEPIEDAGALCYAARRMVNDNEARMERVRAILRRFKRAIVFYSFDYELELLRGLHGLSGVSVGEYNGHKHEALPDGESWVYLVNYASGAEGWNCVTTGCMIFFSLSYSWRQTQQCMGRIDRMNTPYTNLRYWFLYTQSDIDLAIRRAQGRKEVFNEKSWALSRS